MTQLATQEPETGFVEADLVYTVDTGIKPVNQTMPGGDMSRRTTGTFENHTMVIRNGRPLREEFALDVTGFEFVDHDTKVADFYDIEQIKSVYYPEIEALIKARTGAKRVVVFDHTLRSGDEDTRSEKKVREPVLSVHNDYTEWSGPQRVRDLLPDDADALLKRRFAVINVWKPIIGPVEQTPLAFCDAGSIAPKDMLPTDLVYEDRTGEIYSFRWNPEHRWFYYSQMRADEALLLKCYDSDPSRARFTAHTAIDDPTSPENAAPRESIEVRTLAFF